MGIYEDNSLLCFKTIFTLELLLAEWLMCITLKRRNHFVLRVVLCVFGMVGISYALPSNVSGSWYACVSFLALFACSLCALKICFQAQWRTILFCGIAAYSAQHIVSQLFDLAIVLMNIPIGDGDYGLTSGSMTWLPIFGYGSGVTQVENNPFLIVLYGCLLGLTYFVVYQFVKPRMEKSDNLRIKNYAIICLVSIIIVADVVVSSVVSEYSLLKFDKLYVILLIGMNVFCCILALYIQFSVALVGRLESEVEILNRLREQEREQYAQTKETIDLINMKCHDLKHQIRKFGETSFVDSQTIKNIEQMISIYDTSVKTDNEVLDVILTEKSLFCYNYGITFTCIADGSALSFMTDEEIYSLFGNLVDNAIEAVTDLPKEDKIISLNVNHSHSTVFIKIYNCYNGELVFKKGLPSTTKEDKNNHGFGMKSINHIVEKYDGEMIIDAKDGIFTINIVFTIKSTQK